MYAIHAAMRRDLDRLRAASEQLRGSAAVPPTVRDGWAVFRTELEFHHRAEDEDLWPMLRERAADEQASGTIDAMVWEHRLLAPALDAVERAFDDGTDLTTEVAALTQLVEEHLDHEEREALPLIELHLDAADWHDFLMTERAKRPARERPVFLAWVLDDARADHADAVLHELPPPARLVYRQVMKPHYDARRLWALDTESPQRHRTSHVA
jgi:iron-sulfur cluster repair protein YtfE (RIC family)